MRWPFRTKATSNKKEARRHYNAKNYDKAEPFLHELIKQNPNDVWAMDVLSRLYMNTRRHSHAVELIQRLISLSANRDYQRRLIHAGCVSKQAQTVAIRKKWIGKKMMRNFFQDL